MIYQRASFFAPMRLGVSFLISQIVLLLSDLSLSRLYHHFLVVANQLFCLSFCSTLTSSLFAVSMVPFTFDTGGKSYEILGLIIFLITGKKIKKKNLYQIIAQALKPLSSTEIYFEFILMFGFLNHAFFSMFSSVQSCSHSMKVFFSLCDFFRRS